MNDAGGELAQGGQAVSLAGGLELPQGTELWTHGHYGARHLRFEGPRLARGRQVSAGFARVIARPGDACSWRRQCEKCFISCTGRPLGAKRAESDGSGDLSGL
eukprot:1611376-Alexandrium_andersonii.AAC.1